MKDSIPPDGGALWDLRCDMSELQDSMVQMESTLRLLCGILTKGAETMEQGIQTIEAVSKDMAERKNGQ